MKKSFLFAVSALLLLLGGCYGDKGNYDYREINEIVIGARGFEGVEYKLRSGIDELKISPYITASQDPGLTGSYEYEWVVVGQVRNPGERTTIARTRDLDYAVNLPSDDYSLLLRITDPATGLMFSRSTTISVSTAYTRGWLVAAEDEEGAAVVDMVSISRDTLLQRDVVRDDTRHRNPLRIWCDNNEYTSLVHGRIYLSTGEGSFLYDRESFGTDDYTVMRNYFANPQYLTETAASDMIQIDDKFRIFLVDGYAYVYSISSVNTGYFGNPVNRYAESYDYVRIGDRIAYNLSGGSGAGSITTVMLYNDDDKRFCYLMRNDETLRNAADTESDLALFPWRTGLDYVTTVNSRFLSGHDLAARLSALLGGRRALRLRFPQWPEARAAAGFLARGDHADSRRHPHRGRRQQRLRLCLHLRGGYSGQRPHPQVCGGRHRRPDRTPGRRKYRLDGIPAHPFAVVQGTVTHTTSDEYE